jgi:hypothetical protein
MYQPSKNHFFAADFQAPRAGLTLSVPQEVFDEFFAQGGLTVYASHPSPWRWMVCSGQKSSFQATLIDAHSFFEAKGDWASAAATPALQTKPVKGKSFEQSRLVKWLTRRAEERTQDNASHPPTAAQNDAESEDLKAFLSLVHFSREDWQSLNLTPSLTAVEIRHFAKAHNAALSDIESAFLPARMDLPLPLADFYIRYLVQARRDVEATLLIAQATHSARVPRLMADALAIGAFEGAGIEALRHEGHEYAQAAIQDTAPLIDAAAAIADQKLALPVDHPQHLLRINVMDLSRLAAEIVEREALTPCAFLLKAKALYLARCDVCRFPPVERLSTAMNECDLSLEDAWVKRLCQAHDRLLKGAEPLAHTASEHAKILRFSR